MQNAHKLDHTALDPATKTFTLADGSAAQPTMAFQRQGEYLVIAASYGALEFVLRLRHTELLHAVKQMVPARDTATPRLIGSSQAYLALSQREDGSLLLRPTLVADATGKLSINFVTSAAIREELLRWLET